MYVFNVKYKLEIDFLYQFIKVKENPKIDFLLIYKLIKPSNRLIFHIY